MCTCLLVEGVPGNDRPWAYNFLNLLNNFGYTLDNMEVFLHPDVYNLIKERNNYNG